ncbi:MAG: hypothetical protein L3K19_07525 [Thermoplasmata archaeon]|nr:hypothetical protein [Thermoplasmata archaeon]
MARPGDRPNAVRSPREGPSRRWFGGRFAATALILGALSIAGIAIGAITLSAATESATGDYTGFAGTVTGLTFESTVVGFVPTPPPSASSGTPLIPQLLGAGPNVFCATTCLAGNLALNETYSFSSSLSGAIQITVTIVAGALSGSVTVDLRQLLPVSGTIVVMWDLGSSAAALTAVKATLHQCGALTCP